MLLQKLPEYVLCMFSVHAAAAEVAIPKWKLFTVPLVFAQSPQSVPEYIVPFVFVFVHTVRADVMFFSL